MFIISRLYRKEGNKKKEGQKEGEKIALQTKKEKRGRLTKKDGRKRTRGVKNPGMRIVIYLGPK